MLRNCVAVERIRTNVAAKRTLSSALRDADDSLFDLAPTGSLPQVGNPGKRRQKRSRARDEEDDDYDKPKKKSSSFHLYLGSLLIISRAESYPETGER